MGLNLEFRLQLVHPFLVETAVHAQRGVLHLWLQVSHCS